jgi:predicted double-glycine peptidase
MPRTPAVDSCHSAAESRAIRRARDGARPALVSRMISTRSKNFLIAGLAAAILIPAAAFAAPIVSCDETVADSPVVGLASAMSAARALVAPAAAVPATPAGPDPAIANRYVIPLPGERQFADYDCGAASLLSVMDYYDWVGDDPDPRYFARDIGTNFKDGTAVKNILKAAKKLKMPTEVKKNMTLADLEKALYGGKTWREIQAQEPSQWLGGVHPVMVLYQAYAGDNPRKPYAEDWADGHWSVVIGMDDENVYLMDPSMNGKRSFIPRDEFVTRWHDTSDSNATGAAGFNHFGIVFSTPPGVAVKNFNVATYGRYGYTP